MTEWRGRWGARACMMECDREESALAPVLPVLRAALEWSTSCWMVATRDTSTCVHASSAASVSLPILEAQVHWVPYSSACLPNSLLGVTISSSVQIVSGSNKVEILSAACC